MPEQINDPADAAEMKKQIEYAESALSDMKREYHKFLFQNADEKTQEQACRALAKMAASFVLANPRVDEDTLIRWFAPMFFDRDRWAGCFGISLSCLNLKENENAD